MWRAIAKAALLTVAGRVPGGPRTYRTLTRAWLGTQASHVDKLARVWPGYVDTWGGLLDLNGADVWVHEGGWTPFPSFANHLVTGTAGVVTNHDARLANRYLERTLEAAIASPLAAVPERLAGLQALRGSRDALAVVWALGGQVLHVEDEGRIPLRDDSVDLCHSGGALEHRRPSEILSFFAECRRVLRPGALMSHVVDHRDHLHHADPTLPFLHHLRFGERTYRAAFGHALEYHNRLLPTDVNVLFQRAGFEPIAVRRLLLPSHRWVDMENEALEGYPGIERHDLAPAFRDVSEADLRTAAAHYLFREP